MGAVTLEPTTRSNRRGSEENPRGTKARTPGIGMSPVCRRPGDPERADAGTGRRGGRRRGGEGRGEERMGRRRTYKLTWLRGGGAAAAGKEERAGRRARRSRPRREPTGRRRSNRGGFGTSRLWPSMRTRQRAESRSRGPSRAAVELGCKLWA